MAFSVGFLKFKLLAGCIWNLDVVEGLLHSSVTWIGISLHKFDAEILEKKQKELYKMKWNKI